MMQFTKRALRGLIPALLVLLVSLGTSIAGDKGNSHHESFTAAKRMLNTQVYQDHHETIYCAATYDSAGKIRLPKGFSTPSHQARSSKMEWEHVVAAENFGSSFAEWTKGNPKCKDKKGSYKGRKCAEKASQEFRFMHSDLYNLYPAIGAVNALRSNKTFTLLPDAPVMFGSCNMKISEDYAEPPDRARGVIARTTKYMQWAYPDRFSLSRDELDLMNAWDKQYPVDQWECTRAERIELIQGNENPMVKKPCEEAGL